MTMKKSNHAVSEVLSVALLLGITIALFGFLNYVVFSFSFEPSAPSVNLIGSVEKTQNNITIDHQGGESLEGNTKIIITIGSNTSQHTINDIITGVSGWKLLTSPDDKNPDKWDFGETVQFSSPYDLTNTYIQTSVMDPTTNTLLLSTVLQQGPTTSIINNKPPTVTNPIPSDGATEIPIMTTQLRITIQDLDGDPLDWTITTSPNIGSNTQNADGNGIKTCTIVGLTFNTIYTWTVTSFDGQHWTNKSYTFTTSNCPPINTAVNKITPYQTSTNPLTITATGPSDLDNITLYYRWSDDNSSWTGGIFEKLDGVDTNGCNVDNIVDIGTESNFLNIMNETVRDGDSMELTEEKITGQYRLNLEYNWTAAVHNMATESICIYVTSHSGGSENLLVNYWTGSTWSLLGSIPGTNTGLHWYNFTAIDLTSSKYTIQLKGAAETSDNNKDTWNIDIIVLHTGNPTGGSHGINWTIWPNANNPDFVNPWSWDFTFPKGIGYYEFFSIGKDFGNCGGDVEPAPTSADARCQKI